MSFYGGLRGIEAVVVAAKAGQGCDYDDCFILVSRTFRERVVMMVMVVVVVCIA